MKFSTLIILNCIDWQKDYLYHYTSFEAAVKILASAKLLFSDFKKLNDINEACGPIYDDGFSCSEKGDFDKVLNSRSLRSAFYQASNGDTVVRAIS